MFLCINFTMFHVDLLEFFRGYLGQMDQPDHFGARRPKFAHRYNQIYAEFTRITKPFQCEYNNSTFDLCVILFDFEKLGVSRAK
ncbi:MAG: hypothetical protein O3B47_05450, partial [bacterium]|nr:hypothetical protein [bacterium]